MLLNRLLSLYEPSACGGGVVSAELGSSSRISEDPEAAGDEELSLSLVALPSEFMATKTEAASRSCTC